MPGLWEFRCDRFMEPPGPSELLETLSRIESTQKVTKKFLVKRMLCLETEDSPVENLLHLQIT